MEEKGTCTLYKCQDNDSPPEASSSSNEYAGDINDELNSCVKQENTETSGTDEQNNTPEAIAVSQQLEKHQELFSSCGESSAREKTFPLSGNVLSDALNVSLPPEDCQKSADCQNHLSGGSSG